MSRNKTALAFIAGSSLLRPQQAFPPQLLLWGLPPVIGLWNIALLRLAPVLPGKGNALTCWLAGALIGLVLTTIGVSTGAPGRLYNLHGALALIMIPVGMTAHGFIWGVIVRRINRLTGLMP